MSADDEEEPVGMEEAMSGEDALVATVDLLCQKIQSDANMETHLEGVDPKDLTSKLRSLLGGLFDGGEWPEVNVNASLIDECYDDFASVLLADVEQYEGDDNALLGVLTDEMADDERMQGFFEYIRGAVVGAEEGEDEEAAEEAGEGEAAGEGDDHAAKNLAKDAAGTDIKVNSFEELILDPNVVQSANDVWRLFISTAASREAAGEAIYAALFESAPSLQSLFVTPRAVQAMRFMNGIASFCEALTDPPKLKILVETLGFGHLHLDVTVPRVIIFRDAIMDLFTVELAERFDAPAREGWKKLLNYVGGAIIYVKAYYADRVLCLLKSWKQANDGGEDAKKDKKMGDASDSGENTRAEEVQKTNQKKQGKWKSLFNSNKNIAGNMTGKEGEGGHEGKGGKNDGSIGTQAVPTTYPEMFMFNAAVMGFGNNPWMTEVLACFNNIVTNVANSARLQEECDVLALRIARVVKGNVNLGEYKSCMLASLRSLLPKDWDSAHEVAWTWLWENVERLVLRIHGQPPVWEKALHKWLTSLDEDQKFEVRKDIYNTFFTQAPAGQDYFKQSNTYLHFIADKIMNMTLELYQNPIKMVDDISALGLRHVGYAIPTELFGPFVSACVEVAMTRTNEEVLIESFRWSLGLTSKMLVRTITEGSTIVMKAINANSQRLLKKAIGCAPRGERAAWMLVVQVGTQSISPLAWSVEAGNLEAATAIIRDLLTFRADRDRYYYGVDELFKRHADIIKILCDQAPDLVPKLLDGLIWRSRTTENGMRRVNYYVKHMLIDAEGSFSQTLSWITSTRDPKLVCHPVVVLVADIVWSKVAYRSFIYGKSWFFFTLLVFISSQSIMEHLNEGENSEVERTVVFVCRAFIYVLSMTQLIFDHAKQTIQAYRKKDTIMIGFVPIPRYLRQWQDAANFSLTVCLVVMLCLEPIIWCWAHQDGKQFYENCPEEEDLRFPYTVFSMIAMFLYYVLLIDLTVVSTRISAFSLVCVRMLSEVALFIGALAVAILTWSCAVSVLKQDNPDFAGIHKGAYALVRVVMGMYDSTKYAVFRDEPVVLFMIIVFGIVTVVFFMNMLIAQLSCAYSAVYEDMVGYARLERAETIVEIMPLVQKKRWSFFVDSLRLNKRLEFNQGDIGVAGGIQMREAANINPTTVDMIRRFGGSTSPEIQWPEDDADGDGDDRFERMEKLIQRTLQRVTKNAGHARKKGGGTGTGTGTGTGSGQQSGSTVSEENAEE